MNDLFKDVSFENTTILKGIERLMLETDDASTLDPLFNMLGYKVTTEDISEIKQNESEIIGFYRNLFGEDISRNRDYVRIGREVFDRLRDVKSYTLNVDDLDPRKLKKYRVRELNELSNYLRESKNESR